MLIPQAPDQGGYGMQAVAFPLETVARRLQVNGGSNFAALTARIVQEGGPAALYRCERRNVPHRLSLATCCVALQGRAGPRTSRQQSRVKFRHAAAHLCGFTICRGIGAASLRVVPMACVSFGTYELARGAITRWEDARDAKRGQPSAAAESPLQLRCSRRRRRFEMPKHLLPSSPAINAAVPAVTSPSRRAQ
jgi:hypothetical protein